jgi:hypothetical protein
VLYVWNPFVYERLSIGHWSLLLSYALLPWVANAALAVRRSEDVGRWGGFGLWLAAASLVNPYGGVTAALMGLAVICGPPWRGNGGRRVRSALLVLALAVLVNLPWLIPAVLRPDPLPNSTQGLMAFSPRSDSRLGTIGSVLSLGGMWNTFLAPPIRRGVAWVPSFIVMLIAAATGWWWLRRTRPVMTPVLLIGLLGGAVALGTHMPVLGPAYRWVSLNAPGGGLLRDSQKFVGLLALAYAIGFGSAIISWTRAEATREGDAFKPGSRTTPTGALAVALGLVAISLVPTMAWGLGGRLSATTYPSDWMAARRMTAEDPTQGRILILPWHPHLPLRWNRGQITLNPARAFLTRTVLTSDRLELVSGRLPAETKTGAVADTLVRSDMPISAVMPRLGARYLIVLKEADWRSYGVRLRGLEPLLEGPTLTLYRNKGPLSRRASATPSASIVLAGDVVTALALVVMAAAAIRRRSRDSRHDGQRRARPAGILHPTQGGES